MNTVKSNQPFQVLSMYRDGNVIKVKGSVFTGLDTISVPVTSTLKQISGNHWHEQAVRRSS